MQHFGIYIHIPFCKKACSYCNFYYSTTSTAQQRYVDAVCKEIVLRGGDFSDCKLQSIYFGGGTPSLLEIPLLEKILNTIHHQFENRTPSLEITLEANPNDIKKNILLSWKNLGINRLSIGIQSFYEAHLQFMNRSHTTQDAKQCIPLAQDTGFENLSADLIFGFPLLQDNELESNIQQLVDFQVPHISAYALTIEAKTWLFHQVHHQQLFSLNEEQQARQFLKIEQLLSISNYQHYEISNYAQPNYQSLHNSSYWNHLPYLGIGASAHSYLHHQRMWNIANHHIYTKNILEKNILPFEKETLTKNQQFNELILLSLRQSKGIDLEDVKKHWGISYHEHIIQQIETIKHYKWITYNNHYVRLSSKGKLYCDKAVLSLFI